MPKLDSLILPANDGWSQEVARIIASDPIKARELANERLGGGATGCTPLMLAAANGHLECVDLLLPLSDLAAVDSEGRTALHRAARDGRGAVVERLAPLSDLAVRDEDGMTPLLMAAYGGSAAAVAALLPGSDVGARDRRRKYDALMFAAERNHPQALRVLMGACDLSAVDQHGCGALMVASKALALTTACVEALLEKFDPNATDKWGQTALMMAASVGNHEEIRVLLAHGADPRAVSSNGSTALILASGLGDLSCAKILLPMSDLFAKDDSGMDAADHARDGRRHAVGAILSAFGSMIQERAVLLGAAQAAPARTRTARI